MPTNIEFNQTRNNAGVIRIHSDIVNEPREPAIYMSVTAVSNWGAKTHESNAFIKLDLQELKALRSVIDSVILERDSS